jgi:hypothetical protein
MPAWESRNLPRRRSSHTPPPLRPLSPFLLVRILRPDSVNRCFQAAFLGWPTYDFWGEFVAQQFLAVLIGVKLS